MRGQRDELALKFQCERGVRRLRRRGRVSLGQAPNRNPMPKTMKAEAVTPVTVGSSQPSANESTVAPGAMVREAG